MIPIAISIFLAHTSSGFESLFDGKTSQGWHGFKRTDFPKAWVIKDGVMTHTRTEDGGDISSDQVFKNFDLRLEWKISEGGNSGIMYRCDEGHEAPWMTGFEYQVLDDNKHHDGKKPETRAATLYAMYARTSNPTKKVGEWNQARIVARGSHVEHWLNGVKVVEFEAWSKEFRARYEKSKYTGMIDWGTLNEGHICLQDHGDVVSYRNIRIKRLP